MNSTRGSSADWWRYTVFYQVYPLSFADSDSDGYGDLKGIISKLDYLSDTLGVDGLWLSPFFRSPMADWGYDISDHTDVDPMFGDLAGAEQLIKEAHARGMKVLFDFVMNHTSHEHKWFQESRSSLDNQKRDWYVWRDPKGDGSPPNNWISAFGGPAWEMDDKTGQYYRHTYLPDQPDLNWRNPEVVDAMMGVVRFWLDRGVDGFRCDAAHQMMKDPEERDNPPTPDDYDHPWKDMAEYDEFIHIYDVGHPDIHEVHRKFREVLDSYEQHPVSVGEIHVFDLPEWASYYGENLDQFHMPFNFHLMAAKWDAQTLRAVIESVHWNVPVGGWTNWTLGNHDEKRLATRLGVDNARLAALLILTLKGTPFIYYGDELGMADVHIPDGEGRDPWGQNVSYLSRDGSRSPMQWNDQENAGFSTGEPWLPVAPDFKIRNAETELEDPASMLNMYRRLIQLRKGSPALLRGSYLTHPSSSGEVLVFRRESDGDTKTVALNLSDEFQEISLRSGEILLSTDDHQRRDSFRGSLVLSPREGVLVGHQQG